MCECEWWRPKSVEIINSYITYRISTLLRRMHASWLNLLLPLREEQLQETVGLLEEQGSWTVVSPSIKIASSLPVVWFVLLENLKGRNASLQNVALWQVCFCRVLCVNVFAGTCQVVYHASIIGCHKQLHLLYCTATSSYIALSHHLYDCRGWRFFKLGQNFSNRP